MVERLPNMKFKESKGTKRMWRTILLTHHGKMWEVWNGL